MINTVEALQALYVKLGGELTDTYENIANGVAVSDYTVIPDVIEAITQKAGSGGGSGSSLPAVTSDDNSKLLTVVNGAWDKADVPKLNYSTDEQNTGVKWIDDKYIYVITVPISNSIRPNGYLLQNALENVDKIIDSKVRLVYETYYTIIASGNGQEISEGEGFTYRTSVENGKVDMRLINTDSDIPADSATVTLWYTKVEE